MHLPRMSDETFNALAVLGVAIAMIPVVAVCWVYVRIVDAWSAAEKRIG